MRPKKYILLPVSLALYAVVLAVISYPNYKKEGNLSEFWTIFVSCLVLPILLYFVLKRREKNRQKFKHPL